MRELRRDERVFVTEDDNVENTEALLRRVFERDGYAVWKVNTKAIDDGRFLLTGMAGTRRRYAGFALRLPIDFDDWAQLRKYVRDKLKTRCGLIEINVAR